MLSPAKIYKQNTSRAIFCLTKHVYRNALLTLDYLNVDAWPGLRNSLRKFSVRYARTVTIKDHIEIAIALFDLLMLIAASIGLTVAVHYPHEDTTSHFIIGGLALVASAILSLGLSRLRRVGYMILYIFPMLLLGITYSVDQPHLRARWPVFSKTWSSARDNFTSASIMTALLIWATGLVLALGWLIYLRVAASRSVTNGSEPTLWTARLLLSALTLLSKGERRFDDAKTRRAISHDIHRAADLLERAVPLALRVPDVTAQRAVQARCSNGALELRRLEAEVVLADNATLERLSEKLAKYIAIIVQLKFQLLPEHAEAGFIRSRSLRALIAARTLLIAIIPSAFLFGMRGLGIRLSSVFNNWVVVVVLLWGIISVMSAIDPSYRTRLDDIKGIMAVIRRGDPPDS